MKKFILLLILVGFLVPVWSQEITPVNPAPVTTQMFTASSFGYKQGSDFHDMDNQGGDGYYAYIVIRSSDKAVNFYFVEMRGNKIVDAYSEFGHFDQVNSIDKDTVSFIVNNHRYLQRFYIGDDGKNYTCLSVNDVIKNVIFYFELEK